MGLGLSETVIARCARIGMTGVAFARMARRSLRAIQSWVS